MTLDAILEAVKKATTIVILVHEAPDGDAIGSALAMESVLENLGKKSDIIIPEYPRIFDFLPGIEKVKKESEIEQYDLAIALDCGDSKILKGFTKYFENAKKTIVIDHHGSNTMYGDINYVNPVAPACCQILIEIFQYYNIKLTKDMATCIMTGIITDTGGFSYNATSETFEFASEILRLGVNISEIFRRTLRTKTKANYELNKIAINRMEFLEEGKIAFTYLTEKDLQEVGAEEGDHEGIVDVGKNIENVEVSIFLHEVEGKGFKISLRSVEYVDVSKVAIMFGGGGHIKAAGAYGKGTLEQIKNKILYEVKKQLKQEIRKK